MIINENCWQYCQYPQSWPLYLLKFVQVVHEIDMSFLHLQVSIISISRAAQLELRSADCVRQRCWDEDCLKLFSTKTFSVF